jgi:hypothetical protein
MRIVGRVIVTFGDRGSVVVGRVGCLGSDENGGLWSDRKDFWCESRMSRRLKDGQMRHARYSGLGVLQK